MDKYQKYYLPTFIIFVAALMIFFAFYENNVQADETVGYIPIVGEIVSPEEVDSTSSLPEANVDTILASLQSSDRNPHIKAIVLVIDSRGGTAEVAEEITSAIGTLHKPIYALIRSQGDSAAYWIASKTNKIFAFRSSEIGSIGITSSYVSNARQDDQNGLDYVSLSSGPYKDSGSPDKVLTADERNVIMKQIMQEYNLFISSVATNRHMTIDQVKALADGSTVTGDTALQDGLIDSVGGWNALYGELVRIMNGGRVEKYKE